MRPLGSFNLNEPMNIYCFDLETFNQYQPLLWSFLRYIKFRFVGQSFMSRS